MGEGRILHVVTDTDRRGAQSAAWDLHTVLESRGWDSRIVALAAGRAGGLEIQTLGPSALHPSTLRALRRAATRADLVIAHGSTTLPACALGLAGSTPFIYVNIGDPRAWLTTRARFLRTRWGLRRAAAVAAISPTAAEILRDWVGVPAVKIHVLPNFRDPETFRPLSAGEKRGARVELGLPPVGPLVLWLGSMSREKRPDLALDVAASQPAIHLALAGGGSLVAGLVPRAQAVGASMLGPITNPERLLGAADSLLVTSDTEGVPGVVIEAGLCGIPVASTDVGFISDVVVGGQTGRLSPPNNVEALAAAVTDCLANAGQWGQSARERCVQGFSTESVLPRWETLLNDVTRG